MKMLQRRAELRGAVTQAEEMLDDEMLGAQTESVWEHFRPSETVMDALVAFRCS